MKYVTDDGREFDAEHDALEWERKLADLGKVRERIGAYLESRGIEDGRHATRLARELMAWETWQTEKKET